MNGGKSNRPRVLLAGLYHETNTFIPQPTRLSDFKIREGAALLAAKSDGSPVGCALDEAERAHWEVVPAIDLRTTPSGAVEDAVIERFSDAVAATAAQIGPFDGVLLILHGAMVAESFPDVEGAVLERLRRLPGLADIPIVAVLDLHANVTDRMAQHVDVFAVYRENPHTDAGETGARAARHLDRLIRTGTRAATLCARPAVIWPPTGTATATDPLRSLETLARAAEQADADLIEVGVLGGFSFADLAEAGPSFTVSLPRGNEAMGFVARHLLDALCTEAWKRRHEGNIVGMSLGVALEKARAHVAAGAPGGPLVMAEPADNIGGGAPGDRTGLLKALLDAALPRAATTINDPEVVATFTDVPPGETRETLLGGKTGGIGGDPLPVVATLLNRTDGRFTLEDRNSHQAAMNGVNVDMGPSVLLRCRLPETPENAGDGVTVLVTSRKTPPFDLGQWRSMGVNPEEFAVLAVKAAVAHRRAYDPIAGATLTVETPGPCASDLAALPFARLRRPIFPLDEET